MDERFRKKVKDFLAGTLDRAGTLEVLDEVRKSEACRNYLEEQASAAAGARRALRNEGASSSHSCNSVPGPQAGRSAYERPTDLDWGSMLERPKRRNWRRILLMMLASTIIWSLSSRFFDAGPVALEPRDQLRAEALAAGIPVVLDPQGILDVRPMTISALLPAGNTSLVLTFLGQERQLFQASYRLSDLGVESETGSIRGPKGDLDVVEVLLPFPDREQLPFVAGERYYFAVELPNGQQSTPTSFLYQP